MVGENSPGLLGYTRLKCALKADPNPHSRGAIRTERRIPVLQHSITPLLRPAEFEDKDDDEDENEAPHEHLQPRVRGVQFRIGAVLQHSNTPRGRIRGRGRERSAW
jgi:hypothetical protein